MPLLLTRPVKRGIQGYPYKIRPASAFDLLPSGIKVRGTNVTIKPEYQAFGGNPDGHWYQLWVNWDWNGWIKPQIDNALAVGANAVRIIGSVNAVTVSGGITRAQYLDRWQQVIDYAEANSAYVYICGGSIHDTINSTDEDIYDELVALAGLVHENYRRILGWDVIQEDTVWVLANAATLIPLLRQVTDVPKSFSKPCSSDAEISGDATWRNGIRSYVDYFDYHIYANLTATIISTGYWGPGATTPETKPILFGEFGENVGAGTSQREARYNTVKAVVNTVGVLGQRVAGALQWASMDQNTVDSDKWGMFTNASVARTEVTNIFSTFPVS